MAFKLSLVADVREWLRGTQDVEKSLGDLADSLDDLAKETERSADDAADTLEKKFTTAFDEVKREAKTTGRKLGDDLGDGAKKAGDGFDNLKDEANESAREAAASFDGSMESIADVIQEVAANAFSGFGPAGAAAGLAAAAGIGLVIGGLQEAADKAADAKDATIDLADQLAEVNGNPAAIRWAEVLRDRLKGITDTKEWFEFWQDTPKTRLEEWAAAAREFGVQMSDVMRAQTGDADALTRVNADLDRSLRDLNDRYLESLRLNGTGDQRILNEIQARQKLRDEINSGAKQVEDATRLNRDMEDSLKGISDAQADAADASREFSENLTDHLSVADEGLRDFVKDGKLALDEWSAELNRRARETQTVKDFTVDIAPKLSDQALTNFARLPVETQLAIANAFKTGGKSDRKKIVQNLEAEGKVTRVDINTSGAQQELDKAPLTASTKVDSSGAVKGAAEAASAAQKVASAKDIEYQTKLNSSGLQGAVNLAAASITPPVIWAIVKVKKEVP